MDGTQAINPFTPDWGLAPRSFVGRKELIEPFRRALQRGPEDSAFTTLVVGPRGSGKTVSMQTMEEQAEDLGWHVIHVNAAKRSLEKKLREAIKDLYVSSGPLPTVERSRKTKQRSFSVNLPILKWRWDTKTHPDPYFDHQSLEKLFKNLVHDSTDSGSAGVVLSIDELQGGGKKELRQIFGALQMLTKRGRLPLSFVGAGLPDIRHDLLADKQMTFLRRCHRYHMSTLTAEDAAHCLEATAHSAEGSFTSEALRILANQNDLYPYRVQLLGHTAWEMSEAPLAPIDVDHALAAASAIEDIWYKEVTMPTWQHLSYTSQQMLGHIADRGGTAAHADFASRIGTSASAQFKTKNRLLNIGYLETLSDGRLRIAGEFNLEDLKRLSISMDDEQRVIREIQASAAHPSSMRQPRCGFMMPKAKRPCIRVMGHSGKHRAT